MWTSSSDKTAEEWSHIVHTHIKEEFDLDVSVICFDKITWEQIVASQPWPEEAAKTGNRYLLTLVFPPIPDELSVEDLKAWAAENDRMQWTSPALYLHLPEGQARSKLDNKRLERWSGRACTGRNWNTALAVLKWLKEHCD